MPSHRAVAKPGKASPRSATHHCSRKTSDSSQLAERSSELCTELESDPSSSASRELSPHGSKPPGSGETSGSERRRLRAPPRPPPRTYVPLLERRAEYVSKRCWIQGWHAPELIYSSILVKQIGNSLQSISFPISPPITPSPSVVIAQCPMPHPPLERPRPSYLLSRFSLSPIVRRWSTGLTRSLRGRPGPRRSAPGER